MVFEMVVRVLGAVSGVLVLTMDWWEIGRVALSGQVGEKAEMFG